MGQGNLGREEILGVVFCLEEGLVVGEASAPRYRGQSWVEVRSSALDRGAVGAMRALEGGAACLRGGVGSSQGVLGGVLVLGLLAMLLEGLC